MEIETGTQYIFKGTPSYTVEHSPLLGRYLVATRNIKKGEVILTDSPLLTGPIKDSPLLCPGCYQPPDTNCTRCGWPICSSQCPSASRHSQAECSFLAKNENWTAFRYDHRDWNGFADCLMIIRCLLLKQNDERKWKRIMEMETNWEQWSRSPLFSTASRIEEFLRNEYGLASEDFSSNDILTVQAILDINAYEVRLPDVNIQAVYTKASLAEHNCLPNTHKTICSESLELTLRAATDIPQGSHITTTYCDILWPTWHRQKYLQWSKFFICSCERCLSATECESHLASLVCMSCYYYSRRREIDSETCIPAATPIIIMGEKTWEIINKDYQCNFCNVRIPARECQIISKNADDALSELDKYASFETIPTYETWLNKWTLVDHIIPVLPSGMEEKAHVANADGNGNTDTGVIYEEEAKESETTKTGTCYSKPQLLLHPQHSLVLDACHTLFLLYPHENSTLAQLKRKESLGAHILRATKPLTGISKFRGTTSYELAMTKAAILAHLLEQKGLTDNLQPLAEEVLQLLGDSQELLKYEPVDQPEGKLAQTGASQLEQLTLFFSELFP